MNREQRRRNLQQINRPLLPQPQAQKKKSEATTTIKSSSILKKICNSLKLLAKKTWVLYVFLVSLCGGVVFFEFLPKISVDVGETLDPKKVLETRFIFQNQGRFSVYDVSYSTMIFDLLFILPDGRKAAVGRITPGERKVESGGKFSMKISYDNIPSPDQPFEFQIMVVYRINKFWPFYRKEFFHFITKKGADGNLHWLPFGSGEPWKFERHLAN